MFPLSAPYLDIFFYFFLGLAAPTPEVDLLHQEERKSGSKEGPKVEGKQDLLHGLTVARHVIMEEAIVETMGERGKRDHHQNEESTFVVGYVSVANRIA